MKMLNTLCKLFLLGIALYAGIKFDHTHDLYYGISFCGLFLNLIWMELVGRKND